MHTGTFHLFTPSRPLLLGDNRSLVFAPYNTTYNPLMQHLKLAHLINGDVSNSAQQKWPENLWNKPHDLDIDQDGDDAYKLMEPDNFFPFAVPIRDIDDTDSSSGSNSNKDNSKSVSKRNKNIGPIPLPKDFQDAIIRKSSNVDELRELIKAPFTRNEGENSSPNANNKNGSTNNATGIENELEAAVQEKFREWLVSSGQIREVADLIALENKKVVE